MKLRRKSKILAAAIAMMSLSTAAAVTGTVAWFTANNAVSATGMNIQAEVENGILIANESLSAWNESVSASHNGSGQKFIPTSTADCATWYHANSKEADNQHSTGIVISAVTPTVEADTNGLGIAITPVAGKNIYLLNHFYVKGSGSALAAQDLYVDALTCEQPATPSSANLNKSLRVAFVCNSAVSIFAPVSGATPTYPVHDVANAVTVKTVGATTGIITGDSGLVIPSFNLKAVDNTTDLNAIDIKVYIYFEGEDANCKTTNIQPVLDNLSISFTLKNQDH